jgi:hypothetical protein
VSAGEYQAHNYYKPSDLVLQPSDTNLTTTTPSSIMVSNFQNFDVPNGTSMAAFAELQAAVAKEPIGKTSEVDSPVYCLIICETFR